MEREMEGPIKLESFKGGKQQSKQQKYMTNIMADILWQLKLCD